VRLVDDDVGSLEHRIAKKAIGGEVLGIELLLLILVGGVAFEPRQRGDHPQEKIELGVFLDVRLDEKGGVFRVKPDRQPVQHHIPGILLDVSGRRIIGGQGMPVSHKKKAFVLVLQLDPVVERPMQVAQMQPARRPHPTKNPFPFSHWRNSFQRNCRQQG